MKKALGISAFLLLWATLGFSQTKFTATASKTIVGMNEPFEICFVVNDDCDHFIAPDFIDLKVLSGPALSSNKSIHNSDTTYTNTYSYVLIGNKESTYNIGAASVEVNGHTFLTNLLKIKVRGHASLQTMQQAQQLIHKHERVIPNTLDIKNISKQIFIKAETDKTNAYVGEQIKVSYKLYFKINIDSCWLKKAPKFNGFRIKKVSNSGRQSYVATIENVNGINYNVDTISQKVIFAKHAGKFTIEPLIINTILPTAKNMKTHMAVDDTRDHQKVKYELKSNPVIIHAINWISKSEKQQ